MRVNKKAVVPEGRVLALIETGFEAFSRSEYETASRAAEELLAIEPNQVDGLYLSGLVANARENFVAAEDFWERAILEKRDFEDPYIALLQLLQRQDRKEDFAAVYELAREAVGVRPETSAQLAHVLIAHDPARALSELDALISEGASGMAVITGRLRALVTLGRSQEAATFARKLVEGRPEGVDETALLGITLIESEQFSEAEEVLSAGIARHPDRYGFWFDRCLGLHRSGDDAGFARCMGGLLQRFPEDPQALFLLAYRDLARGRFAEGFARYESRKRLPGAHVIRSAPVPEWRGEVMPGKRLMVFDEQGYGDNLMFARFLPRLLELGMDVTLTCPDALYALMAWQPALRRVRVVKRLANPQWDGVDRYIPIMSLAHVLGVDHPVREVEFPYLSPPPDLVERWRGRLNTDSKLKVGVAWAANPRQSVGRERSVPWDDVALLFSAADTHFYSLQVGPGRLEGSRPEIEDLAPELYDFADTFAVVSELDLVITVDTSVAHVAGALGKACWVMAPFLTDWRFSADANGMSWWYPRTRVFRQPRRGDWRSVVVAVRKDLENLSSGAR